MLRIPKSVFAVLLTAILVMLPAQGFSQFQVIGEGGMWQIQAFKNPFLRICRASAFDDLNEPRHRIAMYFSQGHDYVFEFWSDFLPKRMEVITPLIYFGENENKKISMPCMNQPAVGRCINGKVDGEKFWDIVDRIDKASENESRIFIEIRNNKTFELESPGANLKGKLKFILEGCDIIHIQEDSLFKE